MSKKKKQPMLLSLVGVPCEIPFKTKDAAAMSFGTKTGEYLYAGYTLEEILPLIVKQNADRIAKEAAIEELEMFLAYQNHLAEDQLTHDELRDYCGHRIQELTEETKE